MENICPPDIGVKNWQPSAFSPRTGLLYAAIFNSCMDLTDHEVQYIPGAPYDGMEMAAPRRAGWQLGRVHRLGPGEGSQGLGHQGKSLWDEWGVDDCSDLVFYGTLDGWFRAVDARSGKVLWSQKVGSGINAQPIAFLGPDKREYIAVYTGVGGAAGVIQHVAGYPPGGNTLYVFSVDGIGIGAGSTQLADPGGRGGAHLRSASRGTPLGTKMRAVAAFIALMTLACSTFGQVTPDSDNPLPRQCRGSGGRKVLFGKMNCAGCHGYDLTGGMGPDLTAQ